MQLGPRCGHVHLARTHCVALRTQRLAQEPDPCGPRSSRPAQTLLSVRNLRWTLALIPAPLQSSTTGPGGRAGRSAPDGLRRPPVQVAALHRLAAQVRNGRRSHSTCPLGLALSPCPPDPSVAHQHATATALHDPALGCRELPPPWGVDRSP